MLRILPIILMTAIVVICPKMVLSAEDVTCRLGAGLASSDVKVSAGGKTLWSGKIEKGKEQTVQVPKGMIEIEARFFDEHTKKTQTLTRPLTTSMCARFPIDVTMAEGG